MSVEPTALFVYGTLRRDEASHHLLGAAQPLGPARTLPHYRLLDCGDYPVLLDGGSDVVVGELYRVGAPD